MIGMHGGVKFYRGAATAARAYVEADRSRADDYYLAEGTGSRDAGWSPSPGGPVAVAAVNGRRYLRAVGGRATTSTPAQPKGRVRDDANALRFVEVVVNGPKTWSLAAALHPEISAALDAAQDRAAEQIVGWLAEHCHDPGRAAGPAGPGPGGAGRGGGDPALHLPGR